MYKKCEICTIEKEYGAKIYIYDHENQESITLDITHKEIEILYNILKSIKEKNLYPNTEEYETTKNDIIWGD